jgi:hypothetical protein
MCKRNECFFRNTFFWQSSREFKKSYNSIEANVSTGRQAWPPPPVRTLNT